MRVIAIKEGYMGNTSLGIVKPGTVFNMPDRMLHGHNGKSEEIVFPTWVVKHSPEAYKEFLDSQKSAEERNKDAALATAGPKRKKPGYASVDDEEDEEEKAEDLV